VCEQLFLSGQYGETVGIKLSNTSPSVCKVSLELPLGSSRHQLTLIKALRRERRGEKGVV